MIIVISSKFADHFFWGYLEKYEFCKFSKRIKFYIIQNMFRTYNFRVFYVCLPDDNKHNHVT